MCKSALAPPPPSPTSVDLGGPVAARDSVSAGDTVSIGLTRSPMFLPRIALHLYCPRSRLGPVAQFHENSKYYSAVPPAPNKLVDENLPHVTIEMPVYKESLTETM